MAQGGAGDDDQRQFARGFYQPRKGFVGRVEQRRQQQQVGAGVGRDGQFGKRDVYKRQLMDILNSKGYRIARRTVAKYREMLGIPVARLRKQI